MTISYNPIEFWDSLLVKRSPIAMDVQKDTDTLDVSSL